MTAASIRRAVSPGRPGGDYYPSPFLDIGSQYSPRSIEELYDLCAWHATYTGPVHTILRKLATYPVTDVVFESPAGEDGARYTDLAEKRGFRSMMVGQNLDRFCFGVSYSLARQAFTKKLTCEKCKKVVPAKEATYSWRGYKFHMTCKCGHTGEAKAADVYASDPGSVKFVRLHPKQVITKRDPYTQERTHFYKIPENIVKEVKLGIRTTIEKLPQVILEAIQHKRALLLRDDRLFVFERTSISSDDKVFGSGNSGVPLIAPVLQTLFFIRTLMKSQEAVALEHIIPMRVVFPMVTNPGNDVYQLGVLSDWQTEIESQYAAWRKDNNRLVVTGFPLGYQQVGGSGRAMLMHQDIRLYFEMMISDMGVPSSFHFGDAQYTGASVNWRALEQEFLGNRIELKQFASFFASQISRVTSWPSASAKFTPFRMADDVQRAAFDLQLVGQRVISRRTFCEKNGHDYDEELRRVREEMEDVRQLGIKEARGQAEAQAAGMEITTKAQIQLQALQQQAMPPPPQQGPPTPQQGPPPQGPPPEQMQAPQQAGPPPGPPMPPPEQQMPPPQPEQGIQDEGQQEAEANIRNLIEGILAIPTAEDQDRLIGNLEKRDPETAVAVRAEIELIRRAGG